MNRMGQAVLGTASRELRTKSRRRRSTITLATRKIVETLATEKLEGGEQIHRYYQDL